MNRIFDDYLKWIALGLIVYMPLHVFMVQWLSTYTGGLDTWKAAKDILIVTLVPILIFLCYRRGLFQDKTFRRLMIVGGLYTLLHGLFVLFDQNDDTYSAIVGSVYNTRLLGYLLLGYVVGSAKNGKVYLKWLLTATVLIASAVSLFGILQYFLPTDLLTHVGYSLGRGVKPLFFIDDNPSFPRVMSTIKDPNSLGAYLILPILITAVAYFNKRANKEFFVREFKKRALLLMLLAQVSALWLTFSRGALIGLVLSLVTLLCIVTPKTKIIELITKYKWIIATALLAFIILGVSLRSNDTFQSLVFHADESTIEADPNEKRLAFYEESVSRISNEPVIGHGPGTAGIVSISNPRGGFLTENYYLQIAYEVGLIGLLLFVLIQALLFKTLWSSRSNLLYAVLIASMVGYILVSQLIHLWSNEAVALQWWLLAGTSVGLISSRSKNSS